MLPKYVQPLAVTLHADSVQPQVCRLHVELGATFLPWGAPGRLPARPLSYPPAVGPQAACSPHPCLFLGPSWEPPGWRQTGDLPLFAVSAESRRLECPSPFPARASSPASLVLLLRSFCRGPVVGAGPSPVESPREQSGSWGDPGTEQRGGT